MPRGKLSQDAIDELRKRVLAGERTRALAQEFGIDHSSVSRAVRGETWGKKTPQFKRLLDALEQSNALALENNQLLRELIEEMRKSK